MTSHSGFIYGNLSAVHPKAMRTSLHTFSLRAHDVKQCFDDGLNVPETADALGIKATTVYDTAAKYNIPLPRIK